MSTSPSASPPGEILRQILAERNWTQSDLAEVLGRRASLVNDIISGRRSITPETADILGKATDVSAVEWLNYEARYQLSIIKQDTSDSIARRSKLYSKTPLKDILRRGWIVPSNDIDELEKSVLAFLGIDQIDEKVTPPVAFAKKSTSYSEDMTPEQDAWIRRALQLAPAVHAQPFERERWHDLIDELKALTKSAEEARRVGAILARYGVKLVFIEGLPKSKIDGACILGAGANPVIAMSLRFDRVDNFWFVLFHELRHVYQECSSIDVDMDESIGTDQQEIDANNFAVECLVPQASLNKFVARIRPLFSTKKIEQFAASIGVHPGIVVGQLHHRKEVPYHSHRKLLVPIRDIVSDSALTDGWGSYIPIAT